MSHSFLLLPLLISIKIIVILGECLIWARQCPRYLCAFSSLIHPTPCEIRFGIFILVVRKLKLRKIVNLLKATQLLSLRGRI